MYTLFFTYKNFRTPSWDFGKCNAIHHKVYSKYLVIPIPASDSPISKLITDIVDPLITTSTGFHYLLSIFDPFVGYPEAIPLRQGEGIIHREEILFYYPVLSNVDIRINDNDGGHWSSNTMRVKALELGGL